jgi:arsenic resistance protein ArsH
MRPSGYYDRVVDVMEELFKMTLLMRGRSDHLGDAKPGCNLLRLRRREQRILFTDVDNPFGKLQHG